MKAVWLALFACAACKGETKQDEPAPRPAPREEPAAAKSAQGEKPASGLPEKGPHPDFPTAASAGTDKIFFLEDPDRGPKAPSSYARPKDLAWTRAGYCETYEKSIACAGTTGDWYVGKKSGVLVVEKRRGTTVDSQTVYLSDAQGKVTQRLSVDREGQVTEALLFTQPGRYTGRNRDGGNALDGCGMYAYTEDKQSRVIESRCLQWLGEPMRDTTGVAITKWVLDARGFNREFTFHAADGSPIDNIHGVHRVVLTRDAAGREILRQRFAASGARVVGTGGCAGSKYAYDAAGRVVRLTCIDTADAAIGDHDGVSQTTYRYDEQGCEVARRFFDVKGAPATNAHDVHGFDYVTDGRCDWVVFTCVGTDGKPRACSPDGPPRTTATRDVRGRMTSAKHFTATGEPGADESYGVFELRYRYDDNDHVVETTCFDKAGAPTRCGSTGFHGYRDEYDDAGRESAETFIDAEGRSTTNLGTWKRTFRYDNYDHLVEERSLDASGKLLTSGVAGLRRNLWDANHRLFAVKMFDAEDRPIGYQGCYVGATCPNQPWHAARVDRRADGEVLTNRFFDADGQLIGTIDCRAKPCFDD